MRKTQMSFIVFSIMLMSVGTVFATDVSTVLELWNVRTGLGGTYTQLGAIDLKDTNPANITAYSSTATYTVGSIVSYSDYAYYCTTAITEGETFAPAKWTKMWEVTKGWDPIGTEAVPFHGNYDGGGKNISNLFIKRGVTTTPAVSVFPADGTNLVGLFGSVTNGSNATNGNNTADIYIKNVRLINVNVTGKRGSGALVGKVLLPNVNKAKLVIVQNCSVDGGTVTGFGAVGGLVGANNSDRKQVSPMIRTSWANVTVASTLPTNKSINSSDNNNPYNIKYGGLVGCNENGRTEDCFATGNVSGGDRVGGLAGCSLGGAIFRSFATGNVTQNVAAIKPESWDGGYGPVVGLATGKLPPGLGGTNAPGSTEYSYYLSTGSVTSNVTGAAAKNTYGTAQTGQQLTDATTYPNWDPAVWDFSDGYPKLSGSPTSTYYFQSNNVAGNFSTVGDWQSSSDNLDFATSTFKPDYTNSQSILIRDSHVITIQNNETAYISSTTINSSSTLKVATGGNLNIEHKALNDNDLIVNGKLEVSGNMYIGQSAVAKVDGDFEIIGNVVIDPSAKLIVNGMLTQTSGTYTEGDNIEVDGFSSPTVKHVAWLATDLNVKEFSANTTIVPDPAKQRIARTWTIGSSNTTTTSKTITFYWDASDDYGYDWTSTGSVPVLYDGDTPITTTIYDLSDELLRSATYTVDLSTATKSRADKEFKIGLENNDTLPVLLSSFTAINSISNGVMIQWVSQSESDLDGYRIYRNSANSLENSLMLDAFFAGTNTTQTQTYTYFDKEELSNGVYYYWIQMIDYDGTNSFYGPAPVEINNEYDNSVAIPLVNGIAAIYPNPFNPVTTIRYSKITNAKTIIELYNLRGQRVKLIDPGYQEKGFYNVVWNGTDQNGNNVASGIYFTRITIGNTVDMKKIVLMK